MIYRERSGPRKHYILERKQMHRRLHLQSIFADFREIIMCLSFIVLEFYLGIFMDTRERCSRRILSRFLLVWKQASAVLLKKNLKGFHTNFVTVYIIFEAHTGKSFLQNWIKRIYAWRYWKILLRGMEKDWMVV